MVSFLIDRVQTFWHSTACHWLHTANWQFLATATVLTAALFVGTAFLRKQYMKKYYLPNLPIIQGVPYFGLTKLLLLDNELKSHEEVLHIVREKGPVAQFYLLGQHIVLINDGFIAKYVMEQLTGKGMFHQLGGSTLSTFSLDTNQIWKKRRRTFRHAFTSLNLKTAEKKMEKLVNRLCDVLNKQLSTTSDMDFNDENVASEERKMLEEQKRVVKIDAIFGSFAVDVIYNIGFDLDRNFLFNHDLYEKMNKAILEMFETSRIANMPMFKQFVKYNIPFPYINKYRNAMNTVREFTKDILQSIREKYREGSLHTQCFAKMLLDFGLEEGLTEEELLSEILLFMVAGHETTAHSLAWIIYAMVKDEALQTRCHDELTALHKTTTTKGKKATDKSFPSTSPSPYATRSKRKSKSEDSPSVQELDEQIGERDGDKLLKSSSTEESTSSLSLLPPYLEAVVKESMRKYPAASRGSMRLVRASEDGITIPLRTLHNNPFVHYNYPDDIHLPKGTWILMNIFALHNWEGNWGDDVNEFKPERFLPSNQEEKEGEGHEGGSTVGNTILASPAAYHGGGYANQQLIFAPFSYGARNCLGMNIAIWEIRSVVSRLLRDYRFEIAEPDLVDEHIALKTDITMKPLHQLPVYVYSR